MIKITWIAHGLIIVALSLSAPTFANEYAPTSKVQPDNIVSLALALGAEKRFEKALSVLSNADVSSSNTYDHRYAKARILTWSGQYRKAAQEYKSLIAENPKNPDVLVSVGYLELFRGNLSRAETYFNTVIIDHPVYMDAYMGLERTYAARQKASEISYTQLAQAISCPDGETIQKDGSCNITN